MGALPVSGSAPRGLLKKTTAADGGLVERPALTPHLEFRPIGGGQLLLVSEAFNTLLTGQIHCDLLPLVDGRRSSEDLVRALAGAHAGAHAEAHEASDVRTALVALADRGYLVSGEHAMARGPAAFWSSLGASPRWAEQRLSAARVRVSGDEGELTRRLTRMGVAPVSDEAALLVVVCSDYLDERHDALNRRHLDSGAPWMLVRPGGMVPLFGPIFRPREQGPCWSCLAYRLRGHQEVHNFLRNLGPAAVFRPVAAEPTTLDSALGFAAAEIAKWFVFEGLAPIHESAISLELGRLKSERHRVTRRPQCFACGDEALHRADRPAVPVRLAPSPKAVANSGGVRAVAPEETLARYRHLVSPVSGVVSWLKRTTAAADPWLHVYWAGSNFAPRTRTLSSLTRSLRSKSAGKGSTPGQSETSALCEALERYSSAFHGDEIRQRRCFSDFVRGGESTGESTGESEAIHPNEVQLFSDRQLDQRERLNARGHPYNVVPGRLDPNRAIEWSPVWSLTGKRHRYLPTSMLYGMPAEERGSLDLAADSNGCAAGNTLEEAILQGFLELVERDAFAIWWYNRLRVPGVDLGSFDDEYLDAAPEYYRRLGRELWLLDVTADLGIPVFVAVSRRTDRDSEDILYGAGAHPDPQIAALRALCELNQGVSWIQGAEGAGGRDTMDPLSRGWLQEAKIEQQQYLAPAPGDRRGKADYPVPETQDLKEDVERCRALVEARGMEFLVLDQTRPDIGLPVVRVIVPGMRHFWERFAPGRLYDVPVAMGWRDTPLSERDLNPAPVIA